MCVKFIKSQQKAKKEAEAAISKKPVKTGTKVDFKPKKNCSSEANENDWAEGHVTKVNEDGDSFTVNIAFKYCEKDNDEKDLPYPNPSIAECGSRMKERTNCKEIVEVDKK